jgi:hypothetical protein
MGQRLLFLGVLTFLQVLSASSTVRAQDVEVTLTLITTTADRICGVVVPAGSATSTEAKGAVKVELQGLASQLVGAGVQGSGGITTEAYQGVMQGQLGDVLHTQAECKLRVFEVLQVKLLPGYQSPTVIASNAPRNPTPTVQTNLPCVKQQVTSWLDQHGVYGNRPFDISIYDDNINWIVNGKPSWKKRSDIAKEEDIFRRLYPMQRYSPTTSSAATIAGQCVLTQDIKGYKQSSTGKVELNDFRFGFTIRNDANGPRIVERETDVLSSR